MTEASRIAPQSQPRLSLAISKQAFAMLEQLKTKGLWGRTRAAVARELLYKGLREMVLIERQREVLAPRKGRAGVR